MAFPAPSRPVAIGPPETKTAGTSRRTAAISIPGVILSQLGMQTIPSKRWAETIVSTDRQKRLIEICRTLGCDAFYEGRAGMNYMDTALFQAHGVSVEFQDYTHPVYRQLWTREQGFISHLSIVDLLFNHGPESLMILTGRKTELAPDNLRRRTADEVSAASPQ